MKAIRDKKTLTVIREKGDPKYKPTGKQGNSWGDGESNLLYHLKKLIISGKVENWGDLPTDVIKKRMGKDGHLVDEYQQYIRSRKPIRTDEEGDKLYLSVQDGAEDMKFKGMELVEVIRRKEDERKKLEEK